MMCRPDFTHTISAETVESAEGSSAPIAQKQHLASAVIFRNGMPVSFLPGIPDRQQLPRCSTVGADAHGQTISWLSWA
jgi:hypothetical protein